jgi:hypothetical protein
VTPAPASQPENDVIIQPGHIELSEEPMPKAAETHELIRANEPSQPIQAPAPERPQPRPMADFATASEMFSNVEPATEPKPERDAS